MTTQEVIDFYKICDFLSLSDIEDLRPSSIGLFGETMLHVACQRGELEEIEAILDSGEADINLPGDMGRTPLLEALAFGNLDAVKTLLLRGANWRVIDEFGYGCTYYLYSRFNSEAAAEINKILCDQN
jgi:uncharacterized protein